MTKKQTVTIWPKPHGGDIEWMDERIRDGRAKLWDEYRWRSVGDSVPEDGGWVLVATPAEWLSSGYFYHICGYVDGEFMTEEGKIISPTYWKPIYAPAVPIG